MSSSQAADGYFVRSHPLVADYKIANLYDVISPGKGIIVKIFWSWQSDHDEKISRYFVKGALEGVISELNASADVDEATRQEITLDHDRKGVPGSPDLAKTILDKIASCDVFVGDVTPVGKSESGKPLINPNVAIELGYALHAVGDRRILMVMNEHFGSLQDLPFDLRHKAGPITYKLPPGSRPGEVNYVSARTRLGAELRSALLELLASHGTDNAESRAFKAASSGSEGPHYFLESGAPVVIRAMSTQEAPLSFFVPKTSLIYLRVMPTIAQPLLSRPQAIEITSGKLPDFSSHYRFGGQAWPNEFGAIILDADYRTGSINFLTQLFLSREVWALNLELLGTEIGKCIPMGSVANLFSKSLRPIVTFLEKELKVQPPWQVEAGAFPVKGFELAYVSPIGRRLPTMQQDLVRWSGLLESSTAEATQICFRNICDAFFEAAAIRMPEKWLESSVEIML
jgi:hypothetical protein